MDPFGTTRSRVAADHALICPDSFVSAPLAGWRGARGVVLVSPRMGARFASTSPRSSRGPACAGRGGRRAGRLSSSRASVSIDVDGRATAALEPGGFAYLAPDSGSTIRSDGPARLCVFEKRYVPLAGIAPPASFVGYGTRRRPANRSWAIPTPGSSVLLPDDPAFDLAVNIFTYQPGATLPMVEVHVMEHGLLMLEGQGVYRLGDAWYPVREGDVIWMAPYCPQWFVAMGKGPARYLYYKDVNRDPLAAAGSMSLGRDRHRRRRPRRRAGGARPLERRRAPGRHAGRLHRGGPRRAGLAQGAVRRGRADRPRGRDRQHLRPLGGDSRPTCRPSPRARTSTRSRAAGDVRRHGRRARCARGDPRAEARRVPARPLDRAGACSRARSRRGSASVAWAAGRLAGALDGRGPGRAAGRRGPDARRGPPRCGVPRPARRRAARRRAITRPSSSCTSSRGRSSSARACRSASSTAIAAPAALRVELVRRGRPRRDGPDARAARCALRRGRGRPGRRGRGPRSRAAPTRSPPSASAASSPGRSTASPSRVTLEIDVRDIDAGPRDRVVARDPRGDRPRSPAARGLRASVEHAQRRPARAIGGPR